MSKADKILEAMLDNHSYGKLSTLSGSLLAFEGWSKDLKRLWKKSAESSLSSSELTQLRQILNKVEKGGKEVSEEARELLAAMG